jgi:hypothetical protein
MTQSDRLTNNITFTSQNSEEYARTGVFLIKELFTDDGIKLLMKASEEDVEPSDHSKEFTPGFDRFSNQFLSRSPRLKGMMDEISEVLTRIAGSEIVFTQAMLLDMNQGSPGFPWHFDEFSFCFIRPEDMAFTLWIPLIPIRIKEQHGGMNWVNQNDFSAKSRMQQWAYHQQKSLQVEATSRMLQWEYYQKRGSQVEIPSNKYDEAKKEQYGDRWAGKYDLEMLDDLKQECDMALGDAFLSNRYTWHKTHKLRPGPIQCRTAIVLRIVSADALFDKHLFEKTMELRNKVQVPPSFGHMLTQFDNGTSMREAVAAGVSLYSPVAPEIGNPQL